MSVTYCGFRCILIFASLNSGVGITCGGVTYTKDIAPILYERCSTCHHPGDIAPMSLMTYVETRSWAKAIREAVVTRRMPPWYADSRYGTFRNDPRLSDSEIKLIIEWVDGGAHQGDSADLPAPPVVSQNWRIGKPDLIIPIPEEHLVDPRAKDDYRVLMSTVEIKQDIWIKAIELQPGNRRVVHHAHVFFIPRAVAQPSATSLLAKYAYHEDGTGPLRMRTDAPVVDDACRYFGQGAPPDMKPSGNSETLTTFVPGRAPEIYPSGYARLIPAGSRIGFQIHYASGIGTVEKDRTRVGFVFADGPPQKVLRRLDLENILFQIPPGAPNHEVTFCYDFTENVRLLSLTPHMHLRGKDMMWELMRPDALKETLLLVPRYDFNWQIEYQFGEPVTVPAGSRLIVTAHFDNSPNNRANPDPSKPVRWGEPTLDEMAGSWVAYELVSERHR